MIKEPLNENLGLKSLDMFQTLNLVKGLSFPYVLVRYSLKFSHTRWCYSNICLKKHDLNESTVSAGLK